MAEFTTCSDFGAPKNKVWHCFHSFPIYFPWSDGTRCHDLVFWMLSFKPTFSFSSFTFIKRLFSFSSLAAIMVVSSAYVRLLIWTMRLLSQIMDGCSWHCTGGRDQTIPKKKKCKKAKWLSEEPLQIAEKRREAKGKGIKERYTHLKAESQRIARRDKKAFLSDQCKKIEEYNRMGKTTDLF